MVADAWITHVGFVGICGNGVCESGESATANHSSCESDCPAAAQCPSSLSLVCSGAGRCIEGSCKCYTGYSGPACDVCVSPFFRMGHFCRLLEAPRSAVPQRSVAWLATVVLSITISIVVLSLWRFKCRKAAAMLPELPVQSPTKDAATLAEPDFRELVGVQVDVRIQQSLEDATHST